MSNDIIQQGIDHLNSNIKVFSDITKDICVEGKIDCSQIRVYKIIEKIKSLLFVITPNIYENNKFSFRLTTDLLMDDDETNDPDFEIKIINYKNLNIDFDYPLIITKANFPEIQFATTHNYEPFFDKELNKITRYGKQYNDYNELDKSNYVFENPYSILNLVGQTTASNISKTLVYAPDPDNDKDYLYENNKIKYKEIINPSQGLFCYDDFNIEYIITKQDFVNLEFTEPNFKIVEKFLEPKRGYWDENGNWVDDNTIPDYHFNQFKRAILAVAHAANAYRNILTPDIERWLEYINHTYDRRTKTWDEDLIKKIIETIEVKEKSDVCKVGSIKIYFNDLVFNNPFSAKISVDFDIENVLNVKKVVLYETNLSGKDKIIQTIKPLKDKAGKVSKYIPNKFNCDKLNYNKTYKLKFFYNEENFYDDSKNKNIVNVYDFIFDTPLSRPEVLGKTIRIEYEDYVNYSTQIEVRDLTNNKGNSILYVPNLDLISIPDIGLKKDFLGDGSSVYFSKDLDYKTYRENRTEKIQLVFSTNCAIKSDSENPKDKNYFFYKLTYNYFDIKTTDSDIVY